MCVSVSDGSGWMEVVVVITDKSGTVIVVTGCDGGAEVTVGVGTGVPRTAALRRRANFLNSSGGNVSVTTHPIILYPNS